MHVEKVEFLECFQDIRVFYKCMPHTSIGQRQSTTEPPKQEASLASWMLSPYLKALNPARVRLMPIAKATQLAFNNQLRSLQGTA